MQEHSAKANGKSADGQKRNKGWGHKWGPGQREKFRATMKARFPHGVHNTKKRDDLVKRAMLKRIKRLVLDQIIATGDAGELETSVLDLVNVLLKGHE